MKPTRGQITHAEDRLREIKDRKVREFAAGLKSVAPPSIFDAIAEARQNSVRFREVALNQFTKDDYVRVERVLKSMPEYKTTLRKSEESEAGNEKKTDAYSARVQVALVVALDDLNFSESTDDLRTVLSAFEKVYAK